MLKSTACPICNNTELKIISKRGQFNLPTFTSICPNDGMVFLSPRWSEERYRMFYKEEYDRYYRPDIFETGIGEQNFSNAQLICERLENSKLLRDNMSILEIGAGMGSNLELLVKNYNLNFKLYAIESSKYCIETLQKMDIEVIANDVESLACENKYDLIILRHVFEHFLHPVKILKKMHRALKEDGAIYLAVPDMMHPKGSLTNSWFRAVHTYYYSEKTLLTLIQNSLFVSKKICSERSELWCIFTKSNQNQVTICLDGLYRQQMKVIKKQKIKSILYDLKRGIRVALSTLFSKVKNT